MSIDKVWTVPESVRNKAYAYPEVGDSEPYDELIKSVCLNEIPIIRNKTWTYGQKQKRPPQQQIFTNS